MIGNCTELSDVLAVIRYIVSHRLRTIVNLSVSKADDEDQQVASERVQAELHAHMLILMKIIKNVYFFTFSSKADIEKLWEIIREHGKPIAVFFLEGAIEFYSLYCSSEGIGLADTPKEKDPWNHLIELLARGITGTHSKIDKEYVCVDETVMARYMEKEEWVKYFRNNQWLVFAYLIKLSDFNHRDLVEMSTARILYPDNRKHEDPHSR